MLGKILLHNICISLLCKIIINSRLFCLVRNMFNNIFSNSRLSNTCFFKKIINFVLAYRLQKPDMGNVGGCRHFRKRLLTLFLDDSKSGKFQLESRMMQQ